MATIDRAPSVLGAPEWQNLLRTRLMAVQADSEPYRDLIEQCEQRRPASGVLFSALLCASLS
jgi:hypothetical protein